MKHLSKVLPLVIFAFGCLNSSHAWAEPEPGEELFIFRLGYFFPAFDTKLRVNNDQLGKGDEVNAENDLGLDSYENIIRGDIVWRMSERNRLSLEYFQFKRTGDRSISRQIQIGDQIYPVGATLSTRFTFDVIPIMWSYSYVKTDQWEASVGAGLQWSKIHLKIDGSASLSGISGSREASADANAPLPLINADVKYYIFPVWSVGAGAAAFTYKLGASNMDLQGNVLSAVVDTDWWFSKYVGVGAAINWFYIGVDVEGAKWNGEFNYQYWGPQLYLSGRF